MNSFLLVYDRQHGDLLQFERFQEQEEALRQRFRLERTYGDNTDIEVVVLVADSEEALRQTHARYFNSFGDLLRTMSVRLA